MSAILDNVETTGFTIDTGGVTTSVTMSATTPSAAANPLDAILAVIAFDNSGSATAGYTPPGTWNEITLQGTPTTPRPPIGIWWHAVGGSEPATQDVLVEELVNTLGTGLLYAGRVTGADLVTFLGSNVAVGGGAATSPVCPSVTPTVDGGTLVTVVANNAGTALTATDSNYPAGHTGVFNRASSASSSGTAVGVSYLVGTTNGVATGTTTWTGTWNANQAYISVSFVIAPAASGSNTSITVESASLALEGSNVGLLFEEAYVIPVTHTQMVLEGQDIAFQLAQPYDEGQMVIEGQEVALSTPASLVVDSGSLALAGQNIGMPVTMPVEAGQMALGITIINLTWSEAVADTGLHQVVRRGGMMIYR